MESLINQAGAFAITVAAGAAAAFFYDYYRVCRRVFRLKRLGTFVGDAMFWLFTTALVFLMLLRSNWGELRLYVFIGLGLGSLIYFRLFGKAVRRAIGIKFYLLYKLWLYFVKSLTFLFAVVFFPFRIATLLLSYPLGFFGRLFQAARAGTGKVFYRLAGRAGSRLGSVKAKLAGLTFWKRKR